MMDSLLRLEKARRNGSSNLHIVRTCIGPFKVQEADDGRTADYQTYLDYVLHTEFEYEICSRAYQADPIVTVDVELPEFARRFHNLVVEALRRKAEEVYLMHK